MPVRAPFEKLGAKIEWEQDSQELTLSLDGYKAQFTIGDEYYWIFTPYSDEASSHKWV